MRFTRRTMTAVVTAVTSLALVASGCGDDKPAAAADIEITGAWARSSPMTANAGAAYLQITSSVDDRLMSASVDPSVAGSVELHETVPVDDSSAAEPATTDMSTGAMSGSSMPDGSMETAMTMRELTGGLPLPAGETVTLEPGSYHLMLLGLPEPLVTGETFDVVLRFEKAGDRTVSIEVRDQAP